MGPHSETYCRRDANDGARASGEVRRVDSIDVQGKIVYSLHRDRLKTLRGVVARVVDQGTHRVGR